MSSYRQSPFAAFPRLLLILPLLAGLLLVPPPLPVLAQASAPMLLPPGFVQETVATGLDGPTAFAFAADGRIFVAQKAGTVRIIEDGILLPQNFIDLSHEVNQTADRGLLGIAVHPRFPAVPYVYLAYVYEPPEAVGHSDSGARVSRVLRVSADPTDTNLAQPGSEVVLLGANGVFSAIGNPDQPDKPPYTCTDEAGAPLRDCLPVEGTAHSINMIRFGPDGALYVANGDGINYGFGSLRAQDIDSLAGKVLRIHPLTGSGYANNPFYDGDPGSNRSKVFALGMRNPFRFSFSPTTGEIVLGDVGNNAWEEINRGRAGANFGWPCFEGTEPRATDPICQPVLEGKTPSVAAVYTYPHDRGWGAAIGGDFYTGRSFPARYRSSYFFVDYNIGIMKNLVFSRSSVSADDFAGNIVGPVQLSMGPDGSLYLLSIVQGALHRIRYTGGANTAPLAVLSAQPTDGSPPLQVRFSAAGSLDSEQNSLSYRWDFGDGATSDEQDPVHVYEAAGLYTAKLTVDDGQGGSDTASAEITVGSGAPTATILTPSSGTRYRIGDSVAFSGTGRDEEDGELSGEALRWEAFLHHGDHVHYDFHASSGSAGSLVYADHGDNTYLELCLTATDSSGLQDRTCVDLKPQEVIYTFTSEPSGLPLVYAGTGYTTPFKVVTYVDAARLVEAPATAAGLPFIAWSDGGTAAHEIIIAGADRTLTATYGEGQTPPEASTDDARPVAGDEPSPTPAPTSVGTGTGQVLHEWWTGIAGSTVADLTGSTAYPGGPAGRGYLPSLELTPFTERDYGSRLRGYLHPPADGDFTFWIAADDSAELWLSLDDDPANAQLIARVSAWTRAGEFDKAAEQMSVPIPLERGGRYYIEVRHKQADGKANLAVAWQGPGGERAVVDGKYLSPAK